MAPLDSGALRQACRGGALSARECRGGIALRWGRRSPADGRTAWAGRLSADGLPLPPLTVPVYDKSAHGGRGDRTPVGEWRTVERPIDIVFVEGWMLGFEPVAEATLEDAQLAPANQALAEYARWYRHIDAWVVLRAEDPTFVLTWRVEAEERMKASGKPGLSRADIEDYIRRFLPAYRTWGGAPASVPPERQITLTIDLQRQKI